jgi:hypothetical protein
LAVDKVLLNCAKLLLFRAAAGTTDLFSQRTGIEPSTANCCRGRRATAAAIRSGLGRTAVITPLDCGLGGLSPNEKKPRNQLGNRRAAARSGRKRTPLKIKKGAVVSDQAQASFRPRLD